MRNKQCPSLKETYFCIFCKRRIFVDVPIGDPPPFCFGKECGECGGNIYSYKPPQTA